MTTSLPARGTARTAMTHEKSPAGRLSFLNGTVPGSPPAAPARAGADCGGTGVSAAFHKKVAASDTEACGDLVRPTGFEPAAFRVGAERSIQLSYGRMERAPRSLAERSVFGCYMDWGASTPSRSKALRRVVFRARTRPRRWLVSSGSSGLFTCTTL